MKDILVIHPIDPTTDCLCTIYEGREDCDVIRDPASSPVDIAKAIMDHNKIICLGHGTPGGLLAYADGHRFGRYIIDSTHKHLFNNKQVWSIWCNSDLYFRGVKTSTTGIHTGMIISELGEELCVLGNAPLSVLEMEKNMEVFCGAFRDNLDFSNPDKSRELILDTYTGDDDVTKYNRERIFVF